MKLVSKLNLLVFFFLYLTSILTVNPTSYTISYLSPLSLANKQRDALFDRYLISSELSLGRFSNLKISISELIGLSLVLNRTAILPKFEQCMNGGGIGMNDEVYFDQLFDSSTFSRASVVSTSGIDLDRLCKGNTASVAVSTFVDRKKEYVRNTIKNDISISLDDLSTTPLLFGEDVPMEKIFSSYPYDRYFLQETTEVWARDYMKDRLLPDRLKALERYQCIVLGANYLSLNWARLPNEFEEVHRELLPNPFIRADVYDFLQKNGLINAINAKYPAHRSIIPFIAIHLRMGDFLTFKHVRTFGSDCNDNPELLVHHVKDVLSRKIIKESGLAPQIVLSTDDYKSPCAIHFKLVFPYVTFLEDVSRFHSKSCQCALFDQELLGASSFFFGDRMSTFSQAVHQIRTLRNQHGIDTTIWL
jgi:hypothetical protein